MDRKLLQQHDLDRIETILDHFMKPAIAFHLEDIAARKASRSKLGGSPLVPKGFVWPLSSERELDFLLQIDLADIRQLDPIGALPSSGVLTFFYDLENQPWGYDPARLDGFRVQLFEENDLIQGYVPNSELQLPERCLSFSSALTLPYFGSRAYDLFEQEAGLTADEVDRYSEFIAAHNRLYWTHGSGLHRMFGNSENIQNDMQLEAQLVTHGFYCGNSSGYNDPRAKELEAGCDDWILLLQLDSDDGADIMWGDVGMLYFWIRYQDLYALRFDRTWMTLQCC